MRWTLVCIVGLLLVQMIYSAKRETALAENVQLLKNMVAKGQRPETTCADCTLPTEGKKSEEQGQATPPRGEQKWNICWQPGGCAEMKHEDALKLTSIPMPPSVEVAWHTGVSRLEYKILKTDGFDDTGRCNGFIINDAHRLVLTALHCLPPYRDFLRQKNTVMFANIPAMLVAELPDAELALFQLERVPKNMRALKFEEAVIGERVWARSVQRDALFEAGGTNTVPNTLHFEGPITFTGAIAAKGRLSVTTIMTGKGVQRPFADLVPTEHEVIRISGQVEPGFSGGPLFNEEGVVVGIVSSSGNGDTYAISATTFRAILRKFERKK